MSRLRRRDGAAAGQLVGAPGGALGKAHGVLAGLSLSQLASTYCWEIEYKRAMARRARRAMRVVAVLVRPCDWRNTRAARFKLLPKDGRPASDWRPADKAYLDAANGIRAVVKAVRSDLTIGGTPQPLRGGKQAKAKSTAARPKPSPTRKSRPTKGAPAKPPARRPKS